MTDRQIINNRIAAWDRSFQYWISRGVAAKTAEERATHKRGESRVALEKLFLSVRVEQCLGPTLTCDCSTNFVYYGGEGCPCGRLQPC